MLKIYIRHQSMPVLPGIIIIFLLFSCDVNISTGTKKDFNTGLTTTYKNMEPAKTFMVMNGEVINHTDIPLGESFLIVNEQVQGLTVKEGKFSVGCSLQIKNEADSVLLNIADLFDGNDVFEKPEAVQLKCTVNTGAPMQWEETYTATVRYWDKYGTGTLTNEVKIKMMDLP
jgi:hypothetical protein